MDNKIIKSEIIDKELFETYNKGKHTTGEGLFIANCSMCHFKKAELIAPSLRNMANNHDEVWRIQKMSNYKKLIDDKYNQTLKEKWKSKDHPNFENLSEQEIKKIINYIR